MSDGQDLETITRFLRRQRVIADNLAVAAAVRAFLVKMNEENHSASIMTGTTIIDNRHVRWISLEALSGSLRARSYSASP